MSLEAIVKNKTIRKELELDWEVLSDNPAKVEARQQLYAWARSLLKMACARCGRMFYRPSVTSKKCLCLYCESL